MSRNFLKAVNLALAVLPLFLPGLSYAMEPAGFEVSFDNQVSTERAPDSEGTGKAHLFETAIVLVSLGAVGAAGVLHMFHSDRKRIGSQIGRLDRFIATTCCIVNSAQDDEDFEPVLEQIKNEKIAMDKDLMAIQVQETALLDRYSDVEAQLTRLARRE